MSFRDNLQHLRASRNMTQEQLAMLVGVSRQSVTKWEAERAYPEMDKLLKLCQIFDCSLDDLVSGDLTAREEDVAAPEVPAGPLEDLAGAVMLALWAVATWLIVYGSLMWGRINVAGYNRASLDGIADADIDASNLTDE